MSELCSLAMWASGRKCCPDCSHPDDVECSGCGGGGDPLLGAFASRIRHLERRRLRNPTEAMLEAGGAALFLRAWGESTDTEDYTWQTTEEAERAEYRKDAAVVLVAVADARLLDETEGCHDCGELWQPEAFIRALKGDT